MIVFHGGKTLWGAVEPVGATQTLSHRQLATSSEWTQSYIPPYMCFEGVSAMQSPLFLLKELSLKI